MWGLVLPPRTNLNELSTEDSTSVEPRDMYSAADEPGRKGSERERISVRHDSEASCRDIKQAQECEIIGKELRKSEKILKMSEGVAQQRSFSIVVCTCFLRLKMDARLQPMELATGKSSNPSRP